MPTHKITRRITQLGIVLVTLAVSFTTVANPAIEKEIQGYIQIFKGDDTYAHREALADLQWKGITDSRLYDVIEKKLLSSYQAENKLKIEANAWLAKGLSFSGTEKYRNTLTKIAEQAPSKKLRKHAATSVTRLSKFQQWNKIIAKNLGRSTGRNLDQKRILNMLTSDTAELVRLGAKRVYRVHASDLTLQKAAQKALLNNYQKEGMDSVSIDAMAWLCKALAQSGKDEFLQTLKEVAENAKSRKVKKYAKKYI